MRKRTSLLLALALIATLAALVPPGVTAGGTSCIENPPPNCQFDPVCLSYCAALHPKDAEARCQCGLGCCMPID